MNKSQIAMEMDRKRILITKFLQWDDRNGCYTDDNCKIEGVNIMTYNEAVTYFFGVINSDFYYTIVNNICELKYDQAMEFAKENNFYDKTMDKLNQLTSENNPTDEFYIILIG